MFGGVRRGARPAAARRASPSFGLPGAAGAAPPVGYPSPPRRSRPRLRRAARPGIVAAIGAPARAQRMENAMPGAAAFDRLAAAESMAGAGIEEPGAVIAFLASPGAGYLTGQALPVAGGRA